MKLFSGPHPQSYGLVGPMWDPRICTLLHYNDVDAAGLGFTL